MPTKKPSLFVEFPATDIESLRKREKGYAHKFLRITLLTLYPIL